ncbi:MAG: 1-phosphofructokinase family hexose kinase [Ancrocorticia sp.]|uniref:1-phosphofructokinase family hexose kinase n=1 Tax=Ancrocorticia sp. TaxID=2593684 RepID=UPI003F8EAA54
MIITLTANPSLDRTVTLGSALVPGGVHRIETDQVQPGGKGINVAFGVARAGLDTLAVFQSAPDDPLLALLDESGLPCRTSPINGRVRTNITLLGDGVTTKVNEPGQELSAKEVADLERTLIDAVGPGDTLMLSGSLAPGLPDWEYARLVRMLRDKGAWVGVDTSDAPLVALAQEFGGRDGAGGGDGALGAAPDFIKPNAEELGQLTGRDGIKLEEDAGRGDVSDVREAALALNAQGIGEVLVTLGGAGAILATNEGVWFAPPVNVPVISTVGAGDSATAGYLIAKARGLSGPERLAYATAYGSVAVSLPGTTIPRPEQVHPDVDAVRELKGQEDV